MPTPDFIVELRSKIGSDLLWLPGVTAVVLDDNDRVLLVKRADDSRWTPVSGILEPGEEPAIAAAREALEEAGVVVAVERLAWVKSEPQESAYPNGDRVQFVDLTFACRYASGEPRPDGDETADAAWFDLDALPPMTDPMAARVRAAVAEGPSTRFEGDETRH